MLDKAIITKDTRAQTTKEEAITEQNFLRVSRQENLISFQIKYNKITTWWTNKTNNSIKCNNNNSSSSNLILDYSNNSIREDMYLLREEI